MVFQNRLGGNEYDRISTPIPWEKDHRACIVESCDLTMIDVMHHWNPFFWILFVFFGTCEFHPVHPAHQLSIARSTCMAFGVGKLAWQSLGEAVGMKRLQVQPAYYLGLLIEGLDSRLFSSSCMLKLAFFACIYSECATWWPKLFCNQTAFI